MADDRHPGCRCATRARRRKPRCVNTSAIPRSNIRSAAPSTGRRSRPPPPRSPAASWPARTAESRETRVPPPAAPPARSPPGPAAVAPHDQLNERPQVGVHVVRDHIVLDGGTVPPQSASISTLAGETTAPPAGAPSASTRRIRPPCLRQPAASAPTSLAMRRHRARTGRVRAWPFARSCATDGATTVGNEHVGEQAAARMPMGPIKPRQQRASWRPRVIAHIGTGPRRAQRPDSLDGMIFRIFGPPGAYVRSGRGPRTGELFFHADLAYISGCRIRPTMAINGRRNKPIGPGGSTRRLHHMPPTGHGQGGI